VNAKTAAESHEAVFPRPAVALPLSALSVLVVRSRLAASKETLSLLNPSA
jgi:hypothetical protein